ncbi:hypothetical protein S40293_04742 [Stachybotrys chartarum IBT 40293]|nr:hypothetical protein S40293_04742 [Stachybotrys chartarum IBT 40293]
MPRRKSIRKRPSTPNLRLHKQPLTADPASPPETPTTSPPMARKISLKPRHQPPFFDFNQPLTRDPSIKPVGNGHQFSYQPALGPDQLSPRSSSSSSDPADGSTDEASSESLSMGDAPNTSGIEAADGESSDGNSDDEASDEESDSASSRRAASVRITTTTIYTTVICDFTIEDMDPTENDYEGLDILYPTEIESNHSRAGSRHTDHLDTGMMQEFRNLNCSNEPSDNEAEIDYAEDVFLKRQQELKRIRRVSMSSSFGKRTHSELSDSDNDDMGILDVNEVGASARRMRKRLHRGSLLFHDPPAPRIDECEEPDSSEDEFAAEKSLAMELPYWTMEIMEVDSS